MQPEYEAMRPSGVSNQIYRFDLSNPDDVPQAMLRALPGARLCFPDVIICGNSVEMRGWSVGRHAIYREDVANAVPDIATVTATDACEAALRTVGAERIAILSPMSSVHAQSVVEYYASLDFDVVGSTSLNVPVPEEIINVPVEAVRKAFARLDSLEVDTFLHVGGALGIVDMIDSLEDELNRPVISVNAATYWYALRCHGIDDHLDRGGRITRLSLADEYFPKEKS
ncbi:MAG: hypothetical protein AAGB11_01075 [Pseudomonadota bacterium]